MKITMITVTFNSEKTLEETIKSVLAQGYQELEYIIVDGASTDQTLAIIEKYKEHLAHVISEKDRGISDAFNKGLALATGEVIGIINSDDLLTEGALHKVATAFEHKIDVLYGKAYRLYQDGSLRDYLPRDLSIFTYKFPLIHPATFVAKKAYDKWGNFNIDYHYCMDRDVLYRMYQDGGKFQYIDEYLAYYRMGGISENGYWKHTLPEGEAISIAHGMPKIKAKTITIYKKIRYLAVLIVKRLRRKSQ